MWGRMSVDEDEAYSCAHSRLVFIMQQDEVSYGQRSDHCSN